MPPLPVNVPAILATAGILTAHFLWLRRARRNGLDVTLTAQLSLAMVLAGLAGSTLFRLVYLPERAATTAWIDLLPQIGMASFGGLAGGLLAAIVFAWASGWGLGGLLAYLDALAAVFPIGWIVGRLGCAYAGDHPGALRSGHPVNLGLIEVAFLALVLIPAFLVLDRKPRRSGFWLGWLLLIYGAFRLGLDQLHVDPPRYFGVTVDQWAYGLLFFSGAAVLLFTGRVGRASGTGVPGGGGATNSRRTRFPEAS